MANPSIDELFHSKRFEKIAELSHSTLKEFVLAQLSAGGWLITVFMGYQVVLLLVGLATLVRAAFLAFSGYALPLVYSVAALAFCFTVLILLHELLHGIALKLSGASEVRYGAYWRRFIFYAEADRHVLNKKQFAFVALAPLVVVQVFTLVGFVVFFSSPSVFFMLMVMATHSFFCAGDIGLLSIFFRHKNVYTFDVAADKKSFFFSKADSDEG